MQPPTLYKPLSQLNLWTKNYNQNDVSSIAASLRRFGYGRTIAVWRENIVMAGNGTLKALQQLKRECDETGAPPPSGQIDVRADDWWILVSDVSYLSYAEAEAYAIADNRTASLATADNEALAALLSELAQNADESLIQATGYDLDDLQDLLDGLVDNSHVDELPDEMPEESALDRLRDEWQTAPGQLWIIPSRDGKGAHRLLCGDSTNPDHVKRLMDGQRAVLFATDPPYLVDYGAPNRPGGTGKDWSDTYHDPTTGEAFYDAFIKMAVDHAITENAAWYCWHASRHSSMLEHVWNKHGAFVHQQIIWVKDKGTLTYSWYLWAHEPCLFGWIKGHKPERYGIDGEGASTVWLYPTPPHREDALHPTPKPPEIFIRPLQQHTRPGDICYEPFSGSGTQVMAAEAMGRYVYGMEIAPEFVAGILHRLKGAGLEPRLASAS